MHAPVLVIAGLTLGCATVSPAAAPGGTVASVERRCKQVLAAFRADDTGAVVRTFDAELSHALSGYDLRQVWNGVVASLGALRSWRLRDSTTVGKKEVRVYDLVFERGDARASITVDPRTFELAGLFFQPADASVIRRRRPARRRTAGGRWR